MSWINDWGLKNCGYEFSVKVIDKSDEDDEEGEKDVKIYDLMAGSPDFRRFKYRIDTTEISYFGIMGEDERDRCLKAAVSEIDKKYINDLFEKSQSAKKDDEY